MTKPVTGQSNIENNNNSSTQQVKTCGKTSSGKTVKVLLRVACGILATICAVAAILTLPVTVPSYAVLRLVDQRRGVKFNRLEPAVVDTKKSLSKYPLVATVFPAMFAKIFGEYAITGKEIKSF
jgi:hypothetical protein